MGSESSLQDADGYERHTVTEMTHSGTAATERVSMTQLEAFSDGASLCHWAFGFELGATK